MSPEEIAAVLEAHQWKKLVQWGENTFCSGCDWSTYTPFGTSVIPAHAAHVAEVLAALIAARLESVERERDRERESFANWRASDRETQHRKEEQARTEKAEAALIDSQATIASLNVALADLRAKVEALADEYGQYETDVWAEDVAHNLRALLGGA